MVLKKNADMKQPPKDVNKERPITDSEHRSPLLNQTAVAQKLLELHDKVTMQRSEEVARKTDMVTERMEKLLMLVVWGPS